MINGQAECVGMQPGLRVLSVTVDDSAGSGRGGGGDSAHLFNNQRARKHSYELIDHKISNEI